MSTDYPTLACGHQSGNNERMVGAAFNSRRQADDLQQVEIVHIRPGHGASRNHAPTRELQTDHIDIWYLHALSKTAEVKDRIAGMPRTEARRQGKIRFRGVSTHSNMTQSHSGTGGETPHRRRPYRLQLHDVPRHLRNRGSGFQERHGHRCHEGDGWRLPHESARLPLQEKLSREGAMASPR
ncbi:MAG: hypothetical protein U5J83_14945 [Bryobacterales bacterium]|nr:hypothetical protein [Bryobacterales bacterium]